MTRIIGILPQKSQANALIDSLKVAGFDRKDMIVSDMNKSYNRSKGEAIYVQTEKESLQDREPYTDFLLDYAEQGIVVSVEAPRNEAARIREMMEQSGATRIVQD